MHAHLPLTLPPAFAPRALARILQECCPCQSHLLLLGARRQLTICSFSPVEEISKSPGERGCLNSFLPTQTIHGGRQLLLYCLGERLANIQEQRECVRVTYRRGVGQGPHGMLIPFLTSTALPNVYPDIQPCPCSWACWDMGWSCSSWGFGDRTSISCSSLYSLLSVVTLAKANPGKKGPHLHVVVHY